MNRKFQKNYTIRGMIGFILERWKIVLLVAVIAGLLAGVKNGMDLMGDRKETTGENKAESYVLIDRNYVYSSFIMITPRDNDATVIDTQTFLRIYISEDVVKETIRDLNLQESYIDIFNKFDYSYMGNTISMGIKSPLMEVDGHSWEEILSDILKKGEERINLYFPEYEVEVIDEPFLMNEKLETAGAAGVQQSFMEIIKNIILMVVLAGVVVCGLLGCVYLLNDKIYSVEDVEDNLDIPVLTAVKGKKLMQETDGIKRIVNEVLNQNGMAAIALLPMKAGTEGTAICSLLSGKAEDRGKKCLTTEGNVSAQELEKLKSGADFVFVKTEPVDESADAVTSASYCDGAILVVKSGRVIGKNVIRMKEELDRNKVNCFGVVLIQ